MPTSLSLLRTLLVGACLGAALSSGAHAAPRTVCTITVNSPDEKETFRRYLPPGDYRFVELVERGRPDWLASACQQGVQCDALVISGHFDGGTEFYTDRLDQSEYLSVEEMERASCSNSCPGVFAQLKEVYLFGCNTLKPEPRQTVSSEIMRSLLRSGRSLDEAARQSGVLAELHAESNRDRMRHIFKDVPLIYGFSSLAPLGRYAGPLLDRYFQGAQPGEIGDGLVSPRLLELFAPVNMTVTSGLTDMEPQARVRGETCRFLDERLPDARKIAFLHEVLGREMSEVRMLLGHLERFTASLVAAPQLPPAAAAALAAIAGDQAARGRYLDFARDADEPAVRVRMMALATQVGWLTPAQEQAEFTRMIADEIARDRIGKDEVAMACARNHAGERDPALQALAAGTLKTGKVAHAAALACLGSPQAHAHVVRALTGSSPEDVAMAQAYLRHRPLAEVGELRALASAIVRMPSADAQVRALEALARQRLADPDALREIARLYPRAGSVQVQRAVAGVLIRSDYRLLGVADLARSLRQYRIQSPEGDDVIDALIRMLQAG